MEIEKQRELCAELRWDNELSASTGQICGPNYHPDLDTPESLKQAKELLEKVRGMGYKVILTLAASGYSNCRIEYTDCYVAGEGMFIEAGSLDDEGNSALVEAVAKLEKSRQRQDIGKRYK